MYVCMYFIIITIIIIIIIIIYIYIYIYIFKKVFFLNSLCDASPALQTQ